MHRIQFGTSDFCTKLQKTMSGMSPLSLAVVFEQIHRGKSMNLKEVFEMEYKIS